MNSTTKTGKVALSDIETRIDAAHVHGWTYADLELANAVKETGLTVRGWMDRVRDNNEIEDDLDRTDNNRDSVADLFRADVCIQFRKIFYGNSGPKESPCIKAQS